MIVDNSYFITKEVREKYENDLLEWGVTSCHHSNEKVVLGTVGVVALDSKGNTCSANSTGGIMHKPAGRVGDTPLCGAGMYARNGVGAAACTGHGEYFVRTVAAYKAISKMSQGTSLDQSLQAVLADIQSMGGRGGMIGLGRQRKHQYAVYHHLHGACRNERQRSTDCCYLVIVEL